MQLDDIEVLVTVSETKSLSQAAERLYMSRPGLSQKIANIEARFGMKLYERTSTGVVPTPAGVIVTKFARKMTSLESLLAAELAAVDENFDSTIEVGMSFADGVTLLPALVKKFHDLHPDALVHLEAGYEPGLLKKLKDGDINFAILENESVEEGIATETLGYPQLLFCAPDKPPYNSTPQPVKIKTLLEWPMIIYEWHSGRHMVGNRHFRDRYGISLRDHNMVARFDTHEAMMNGARAGLGWTSVPRCIARRYRNDPNIIWFEVDTDPMRYPIDLAWNAERAISPLALEFMDFVRNNIPDGYFCSDDKQ
ncbi:LysR family transcriptional regulator [Ellagibacter isourolithinifaciens]|uniref:LysR family transcriptional regulator n=1 Tax=Ellagibacter isourolithinifaciens TaxID=2137581 RepID=UPI003FD7A8FD